ncbi:MAG TPA: hypothetical protein VE198_00460 [Actinoallomurus sp.]|nr:hypothetical protein [Actinoallomurus sp.]
MKSSIALTAGLGLALLAVPAAASAHTAAAKCGATMHDHVAKADSGHGTPAEWADLSLTRTTTITCDGPGKYTVLLLDYGTLETRPGGGTPNGAGGTIAHRVPGKVTGIYNLDVTGTLAVHVHRDTSASSTAYVAQLFTSGATVTGGAYEWNYGTGCEHWTDSSENNDGQGAGAGNITGKACRTRLAPWPKHSWTPSHSPTPSPSPADTTAPGEAPAPTPVNSDLPVTG